MLVLCWKGNGIWDELGTQSWLPGQGTAPLVLGGRAGRGTAALVPGPALPASTHGTPPGCSRLPAAELGFSQERAACPFGLGLPTRGAAPTQSITSGSPPGAPPAPSWPRSAWCNSGSRSRSSRCWDAARQELIPLVPVLGYSTAGADPLHPTVGMQHGRS